MSTTHRFPRLMTIGSVYQPVAEYLDGLPRRPVEAPLNPLDCYLIHLAIEFCPGRAAAFDLACESTCGASTVATLSNTKVRGTSSRSGAWPVSPGRRLDEFIREFACDAKLPGAGTFAQLPVEDDDFWTSLAAQAGGRDTPLVLLPSSVFGEPGENPLAPLFEALPNAVALVLGAGRISESPATRRLIGAVHAAPGLRAWLLREHAHALASSSVVVVAGGSNRAAAAIVERIEAAFTTNYDFLALVRDSCLLALERGVRGEIDFRQPGPKLLDLKAAADDPSTPMLDSVLRREVARESIHRLQGEVRRLELRLLQEENRPLAQSFLRRSARKVVHFGRRHRHIFAPKGSTRERIARSMLQMGRGALRAN